MATANIMYALDNISMVVSAISSNLGESKAALEQRLGHPSRFVAFPNGDFNPVSTAEMRAAGYDLAFTQESQIILPGGNPYLLPRLGSLGSGGRCQKCVGNF
jgi:hypothetical protein